MSDFKGTPGPWKAAFNGIYYNVVSDSAPFYTISSGCFNHPDDDVNWPDKEGAKANARLMAAAPDLLDALTALKTANGSDNFQGWHSGFHDAIEKANAAIAKALGKEVQS